uniref:Uncharacterized protein n=1 Tax=Tanacetum cinerariifolium TaxID=118510 RepID=A0A699IBU1_TANCI|nr:hypothetical protein [Tanacetum cinerariifolium]
MIACSISGKGQAPEKVTSIDLFYLRTMDRGTANVPYLLAKYLFRHAGGGRAGLGYQGVTSLGPERQQAAAAGAPEAAKDAPAADEGAQAVPAPVQAPQPSTPAPQPSPPAPQHQTITQRIERLEEEAFDSTLIGSSLVPYQRRVTPRTGDANTSTASHTDDQPDP